LSRVRIFLHRRAAPKEIENQSFGIIYDFDLNILVEQVDAKCVRLDRGCFIVFFSLASPGQLNANPNADDREKVVNKNKL
jgi:hypothetical protein